MAVRLVGGGVVTACGVQLYALRLKVAIVGG